MPVGDGLEGEGADGVLAGGQTLVRGLQSVVDCVAYQVEQGLTQALEHLAVQRHALANTHHPDAVIVGGYRDLKLLGKFTSSGKGLSMIVEIQIIDAVFLAVKQSMHKPFSIARGDFW